jgi:long-subunit acyl-CoA synthetase (AMP-forming)
MVLEAQSPTIIRFWDELLPEQHSEQACIQLWQGKAYIPTSFKDVHAQAHCVAGYLMRRGLAKGDHIGILAKPGLRYHVLHIALQYLGVVNVTFPPDMATDDIVQMAFRYDFKMLFVETVAQFQAHDEFRELKAGLHGVIIGEDDVDALEPEKIVTFDRVVTLGKAAWREDLHILKAMKAAMLPKSICAILVEPGGKTTPLSMERWMQSVDAASKQLASNSSKNLLSTLGPDRLLWRSYSFAAVTKRILFWVREDNQFKTAAFPDVKPETILMDPSGLRGLYDLLPEWLDKAPEKGRRAITEAMEVVQKRDTALAHGQKDKFMNRLRYRTSNRKLYARIKTKLGGNPIAFVCDQGPVDADVRLLFEECGFKITQG